MFSILLKKPSFFVQIVLVLLALGGISLTQYASVQNVINLSNGEELLSIFLFILTLVSVLVHSTRFDFHKKSFFFQFLILSSLPFVICCFDNLNFYAALFFLSLVLFQILNHQEDARPWLNPFDLACYIGISALLFPPFWIFGLFILVHFITLGTPEFRKLFLAFMGLLFFTIFLAEVIFIFELDAVFDHIKNGLHPHFITLSVNYLFLLPIAFLFVVGLVDYYRNINRKTNFDKRAHFTSLLFLVFSIICFVLYGATYPELILLPFIAIPFYISNILLHNSLPIRVDIYVVLYLASLLLYKYHHLIVVPQFLDNISL